jgi:serine/threonine protein kinase
MLTMLSRMPPRGGKTLEDVLRHENESYLAPIIRSNDKEGKQVNDSNAIISESNSVNNLDMCFDWKRIVAIATDILEALSFLHENGTVHGDIQRKH